MRRSTHTSSAPYGGHSMPHSQILAGVFTLLPASLPVGVGGCDELGVPRSRPLLSDTPDAIVSPADPAAAGFADAAAAALAAFC